MGLKQAVMSRVSRRSFTKLPIEEDAQVKLFSAVEECNMAANMNIQLITEDKGPFKGVKGAMISGASNYLAMVGKADDEYLLEKVGYYGESLVLLAVQLGLGTCWLEATFDRDKVSCEIGEDEELVCIIVLGNVKKKESPKELAVSRTLKRRHKEIKDMLFTEETPENWVIDGMRCVVRAPSSVNRQPVKFYYTDGVVAARVDEKRDSDLIDLGIAKLHFEIGAEGGRWEFGNGGIYER